MNTNENLDYSFELPPELVKKYLTNRHVDLTECFTALETQDFNKIAYLAHQMKGNGTSFGFSKISDLSGELEIAAKNENTSTIKTCLQELTYFLEHGTPSFE